MRDNGTSTAWVMLLGAGLLEIAWATALKQSDGFTRLWPSALGITLSLTSFILLAVALQNLPVGTAYAVWVGIGALGVALAGMLVLGEPATLARVGFLTLIVIGVAGLKLVEQ